MPAKKGVTAKSSRWAFVIDCEQYDDSNIFTALGSQNITGAVSPLHDLDTWDRADIYKYMLSRSNARNGVLFFFDDELAIDPANGFSYKDALQRSDLPILCAWSKQNSQPKDSVFFDLDESGKFYTKVLPALGELKRKHRHVQMYFPNNPIPWSTAFNRLELGGIRDEMVYYIEPVNNWEGLLRYYAHLDNPEKAQYQVSEVKSFYGFDLSPLYRKSEAGKVAEFELVYAMVRSMGSESCSLLSVTDALMRAGKPEIAKSLSSRAGYWREIIFQMQREKQQNTQADERAESDISAIVEKLKALDARVENLE